MPLGPQLLALQALIVLSCVVLAGFAAVSLQQRQIRQAYSEQMLAVARNAATLPDVQEAYAEPNPSTALDPLADLLQQASKVSFVVFLDRDGIRLSHPDKSRIGSPSTTSAAEVLRGDTFVGTQTGTLGPSLRAKVPITDSADRIIGAVSVGIVESELDDDFTEDVPWLAAWLGGAAVLGSAGSYLLTRLVRRRIMGLEPDEIARLLQAREAMLHGIREGVLAVDERGRVVLVNDEACRLLDLDGGQDDGRVGGALTGRYAADVLDPAALELLEADDDAVDAPLLVGERVLLASRTPALVHGRRVGRVLTVRDRTELSGAVRELDGQRSLTTTLRAQAHEFSNQLHVLQGLLELGRTADAVALIDRLGGGGRLLSGAGLGGVEDASVSALLMAKAALARERGATLVVTPATRVPEGAGDDVITVLGNLVDNALDAAGQGGRVVVDVQGDVNGDAQGDVQSGSAGGWVLTIDDDGPGVPEPLREEVFRVGVTTKAGGDGRHGQGIGLALVARIAARRGGSARVTRSELGGARFEVVLGGGTGRSSSSSSTELAGAGT
ncbi:two-component system, CitB family, sensor kinase [Quadrisphaera granulorum]|uniref:histidine kinase n=2 Tax=Quadrisphaera granulorum TaxID=317664 RepID=A0A316AEQ1_9ACTN|nr:two-component system CitB family sensor kinase [Quadrisphaera granulorum]SZE95438.1 two-component system, CitB family, sensor kinase [Quadrisphaera granulorum]